MPDGIQPSLLCNCCLNELKLFILLRLVICNRLVNLGISKQQHLYLKTKNLI